MSKSGHSTSLSPLFEQLEPRLLLSANLPGLHLVDPTVDRFDGQVIYLDLDGEEDVTYNGPVTVENIDVPAFSAPGDLAGQEQAIIDQVLDRLDNTFADTGLTFTTERPGNEQVYSTIFVGGDDAAFSDYGSFLGLAEQVDIGNQNPSDSAFVFSEVFVGDEGEAAEASALADIIAHETGHLLGYAHDLSANPAEPLADVAAVPDDRTFTHPSEDGSGDNIHNITLAVGTYTFQVDADPDGYHRVDWFTTYSGTSGLKDTAYLYYYDNEDFSFSTPGTYWVRTEVYRSDFWNNTYEWEAVYRWRVTVPEPPNLDVDRNSLDFDYNDSSKYFYVQNDGGGTLDYQITDNVDWLTYSRTSGSTSSSSKITVYLDRSEMDWGYNQAATITARNADDSSDYETITVTADNPDPAPRAYRDYPTDSSLTLDYGDSHMFRVRGEDDGGDLWKVEWTLSGAASDSDTDDYWFSGSIDTTEFKDVGDYTFDTAGDYTLRARVYDDSGDYDDAIWSIHVNEPQEIISAYWWDPTEVTEGETVTLCAEVSGYSIGDQFTFDVYENDGIGISLGTEDEYVATLYGSVYYSAPDSGYFVKAEWQSEWQEDGVGEPEFIFNVYRGSDSRLSRNEMIVHRAPRQLEVPYYNQDGAQWCWASSTAMLLEYYGYDAKPWTIAADDYFNKPIEEGEYTSNVHDFLEEYYDSDYEDAWSYGSFSLNSSIKSNVMDSLRAGHPVYFDWQDTGGDWAHIVIATGYDGEADDDHVFVHDPSGALVVSDLVNHQYTWSGFFEAIDRTFHNDCMLLYARPEKLSLPSSPPPASVELLPGELAFLGQEIGNNLHMKWDGTEPYLGYRYQPDANSTHPEGLYGYAAVQADELTVIPAYSNSAYPYEDMLLKLRYVLQDSTTQIEVDHHTSSSFMVSSNEWVFMTPEDYRYEYSLASLTEGVYTLEVQLLDGSTDETYDECSFDFELRASDYRAASPLVAGFTPTSVHQGDVFSVFLDVENAKDAAGGAFTTAFYASTDTIIDPSEDYLIYEVRDTDGIAGGQSTLMNYAGLLPASIPMGTYYVGWVIDVNDENAETNEDNNVDYIRGQMLTVLSPDIDVELPGQPDDVHNYPFGNVEVSDSISCQFKVRNEGNEAVVVSGLSGLDSPFAASMANTTIQPGQTDTLTITYSPQSEGAHSDTLIIHSNDPDEPTYEIALTGTGVPMVQGDEYEDDDVAIRATVIPTDGTPQTQHSIHVGSDVDWVKFTLTEKSHVTIETDGPSGDTRMWLYGPDSWSSEIEYDNDDGNGYFSKIVRSGADALDTGTYYVKIDEYGNNNVIGNYTISVTATEAVAPTVLATLVSNGEAQRSMVTSVAIQLSEDVSSSLTKDRLVLHNLTTGEDVAAADMVMAYDSGTDTATWTFPGLTGGSLPDGNYAATLLADGVTDAAGNPLDGDGNGIGGDDYAFDLFRFFGDINGDRYVGFADLSGFSLTYQKDSTHPQYDASFDANADNYVGFADLDAFAQNYQKALEVPFDIIASADELTVPEGGTGEFTVVLSAQPRGTVTVTTARTSGDEDLTVASGGTLTFDSTNWNIPQPVTLAAAEDTDTADGTAEFTLSYEGAINESIVTATEVDNDEAPPEPWAVYVGGSDWDCGSDIAIDGAGDLWVVGGTNSSELGATGLDVNNLLTYVAKLDSAGNLLWTNAIDGGVARGDDGVILSGITVDDQGNAFVVGTTKSDALIGANNALNGPLDAFVAKIGSTGDVLWSTYVGGSSADAGAGIAVDAEGDLLVVGLTKSASFDGAVNSYKGGSADSFVAKISDEGHLLWVTFVGGSDWDMATGVATDANGNALICGDTKSDDLEAATNAPRGGNEIYAAKVSPSGSVIWSTYTGATVGGDLWWFTDITVDHNDRAWIAGTTDADGLLGASNTRAGGDDAFVTHLGSSGSILSSAYIGGSQDDWGTAVAIDTSGGPVVAGGTKSANLEGASNAYHGDSGSHSDCFVTWLGSDASVLETVYVGGSSDDIVLGIALGIADHDVFLAGLTDSADLEWAGNAFEGESDAFVAKMSPNIADVLLQANFDIEPVDVPIICGGAPLGQPVCVSPFITAVVRNAPVLTPALEIQDNNDYAAGAVRFEFLGDVEINEGSLMVTADLWFDSYEDYFIYIREQGSSAVSFANFNFYANGYVTGGGSYSLGEAIPLRLKFDMDAGTYDFWFNSERLLDDSPLGDSGAGIGAILFGTTSDTDLDGRFYVDNLLVTWRQTA